MVSSELVVLLIVCVGINTGSAQEYCRGGPFADRTCQYISNYDTNTDCMDTTLQCPENSFCSAFFNGFAHFCIFDTFSGVDVASQCCFCNDSTNNPSLWWNCGDMTIPPPPPLLPSSTTATVASQTRTTSASSDNTRPVTTTIVAMTTSTTTDTTVTSPPSTMDTMATMVTTSTVTMTADITSSATPTAAIAAIASNLIPVIVPVVVVVLVVCLLVVCAIATIIILYQRAKRHHNHQQDTTKYELTQPAAATVNTLPNPIYNTLTEGETPAADYSDKETPAKGGTIQVAKNPAYFVYSTIADAKEATSEYSVVTETTKQPATPHDDGQYNPTHHEHTDPPPTYSTLAEEGVPADYQTIADNPAYKRTVTEGGAPADYSVITETQDTSDGGMVYSAVVRKDGKKTTVKTTPQDGVLDDSQQQPASDTSNEELVYSAVVVKDGKKTTVKTTAQNVVFDDSQQQPASDTSNEGLVYSAVVVKDGKKTTVKTMATTQNEDNEQTSSTSDTVQPAEGMVYSAVIRQDGKKTSVKVTVE